MTTLVLEFSRIENDDETKYSTFYSNSKAETTVNESNTAIADIFESIYITVISNIRKFVAKGLSWIINSVKDHNFSISKLII